jgi:hypothetical protein
MSTTYTQIPGAGGLSVTANNQGGASAIGPQQPCKVGVLALTYPTGLPLNPVLSEEVFNDATLPAIQLAAEIVCVNTAGVYSLVVPFKCKVIGASFVSTGVAPHAGDTFAIGKTALAGGAPSVICAATAITAAATSSTPAATVDLSTATLLAGDTLTVTTVKNTNVAGSCFVTLVPVA